MKQKTKIVNITNSRCENITSDTNDVIIEKIGR